MSEWNCEWAGGNPKYHTALFQFYRVEIDATKRLMRAQELRHDYERMMSLITKESA